MGGGASHGEAWRSLSNRAYAGWIDSWLTPAGDGQFYAFLRQFKAHLNYTPGRHCTSSLPGLYEFASCDTCTGGCRAALSCLQLYGLDAVSYEACVARVTKVLGRR